MIKKINCLLKNIFFTIQLKENILKSIKTKKLLKNHSTQTRPLHHLYLTLLHSDNIL